MPFDDTQRREQTPLVADLEQTRALIERGWCQMELRKLFSKGRASHCLEGAAMYAAANHCGYRAVVRALYTAIDVRRSFEGVPFSLIAASVHIWNDDPARTKPQVLALVDDAIAHARQEAVNEAA